VALEALNRLEGAETAIYIAIEKCNIEIAEGTATKNSLAEYQDIQKRVEATLKALPPDQQRSAGPSLYKPLKIKCDDETYAGSMTFLFGLHGVLDKVFTYLKPEDVARLEQTCRRFAVNPERGRRLALSSPLRNIFPSEERDKWLRTYCNEKLQDHTSALRELVASVFDELAPSSNDEYFLWRKLLPLRMDISSLNTIMSSCVSFRPEHLLDSTRSSFDYCACKWLLQSEKVHPSTKASLLMELNDEFAMQSHYDDQHWRGFYRYGLDDEIMRLALSLESIGDNEEELYELRKIAFMVLNNSILSNGVKLRQSLNRDSPLFALSMSFNSVYNQHIPKQWPGKEYYFEEIHEPTQEDVEEYWRNENPRVFRMWKSALFETFKWLRESEKYDLLQYILLNQFTMVNNLPTSGGKVPISCYSFGAFLVKRSMEHGGAIAFTKHLINQRDFAKLIADFYTMTRLYSKEFPKMLDWQDTMVAQDRMAFG
jgi:hypothetical protein